ncbi:TPA: glycosyltransferase family 2 protein [Photobacterium damselae]
MISVCLATYNGSSYIMEQINSILTQLSAEDELIISDDGSTDNTLDIILSYDDVRIKVFSNKGVKGYTHNFESALKHCSGDVIFLSDQDDIWLPNKVSTCMKKLKNNDFVVHNASVVDSNLKVLERSYFKFKNVRKGFLSNLISIRYLGCCMAFNRDVLNKALPFPIKNRIITHDSWLSLISELYFKTELIETPLILYRRHENNTSMGGASEGNSLFMKVKIRIYSVIYLFNRMVN